MSIPLTAGATLHPLVLPARADAGPTPLIQAYAEARNASIRETTGRDDDALTAEALMPLLRSSPERTRRQWYVEHDGEVVGCSAINLLTDDDGATAIATIALAKRLWGRGIGAAAYRELEADARGAGAAKILHWAEHHDEEGAELLPSPTGFGAVPLDHAARFLRRQHYALEQVVRVSALIWDEQTPGVLTRLREEAAAHANEYRIVQWTLPTPAEHVDGYAWLKSRMSTDTPDAELGQPEELWDAERVARHDDRYAQMSHTVLVTAAQHVATGVLCAFNELSIGPDEASVTHQEDTLVAAPHRGHRLGMLVKTAGLLTWREHHPQSSRVVTYNAEENRPMLSINEAIGFVPIAYEGAWKKVLT